MAETENLELKHNKYVRTFDLSSGLYTLYCTASSLVQAYQNFRQNSPDYRDDLISVALSGFLTYELASKLVDSYKGYKKVPRGILKDGKIILRHLRTIRSK